jgi:hypothetical protein
MQTDTSIYDNIENYFEGLDDIYMNIDEISFNRKYAILTIFYITGELMEIQLADCGNLNKTLLKYGDD